MNSGNEASSPAATPRCRTNYGVRYLMFALGIFALSLGVAISIKADLGTTTISCIPYLASLLTNLSVGTTTIIWNIFFVLLQILILRKKYQKIQLFQIVVAFGFGYSIDFAMWLVSGLTPVNYLQQWLICILGIFITAFGVFLEVKANVLMVPGEGIVWALAQATKKRFGKLKVAFDCTLIVISVFISLVAFHTLVGVREGTIAAAIFVGFIVMFYNKRFTFINKIVGLTK